MAYFDETTHSWAIFKDKTEFLGVADVALPDITFMTDEIKGAGLGGKMSATIAGMTEAMTTTLNWRNTTKDTMSLAAPDVHNLELRQVQQGRNSQSQAVMESNIKYIMRVKPKNLKLGKVETAAQMGSSSEFAVYYLKMVVDGKTQIELDPLNFKAVINGKDYLAKIKKALGK
jgi:P2 family phage contractile tail tube protein